MGRLSGNAAHDLGAQVQGGLLRRQVDVSKASNALGLIPSFRIGEEKFERVSDVREDRSAL
jgi:hypothetical protein